MELETMSPKAIDEMIETARTAQGHAESTLEALWARGSYRGPAYCRQADEAKAAAAVAKRAEALAIVEAGNGEFARRGGWARWWLVVSSDDGHVHTDGWCPSFRARTAVVLVWAHSGDDRGQTIAALRETVCTVCVPEAPVAEIERLRGLAAGFPRLGRAIADAARAAAKDAKAIAPTRTTHDTVTTLVTARNELTKALVELITLPSYRRHDDSAERTAQLDRLTAAALADALALAEAIAVKLGTTRAAILAEHQTKAQRKARQQG